MKASTIEKKIQPKHSTKTIQEFQNVLMGIRIDDSVIANLKYVDFLSRILKFKQLTFLNVMPFYNYHFYPYLGNPVTGYPIGELQVALPEKADEQKFKEVRKELQAEVKAVWEKNSNTALDYLVREGSPLEEFIKQSTEMESDLVILGKRADSNWHQIKAKNIIRQVDANVLMIPEKAASTLGKILVPFDFSENSIRALNMALVFQQRMSTPVIIEAINVYGRPDFPAYKISRQTAQFDKNIAARHWESFEKFLAAQFPETPNQIKPVIIEKGDKNVVHYLLKYAEESETDLIVMGAKGHSKLELLLMGSTTERILNRNNRVPTLIVK